jgi:type II secretory pathway pseudopilin PulG
MIEVVIVFAVLLIVSLVAVPAFNAFMNGSDDHNAQVQVSSAVAAEDVLWRRYGTFVADTATLTAAEGSYTYVAGTVASTLPSQMSVAVSSDAQTVGVAARSDSGRCVAVRKPSRQSTVTSARTVFEPTGARPCTGGQALTETETTW